MFPSWSSGPNSHMTPGKDTHEVFCDYGFSRLTLWHTLPMDASALITLFKPDLLRKIANAWAKVRTVTIEDGWSKPIEPDPKEGEDFGLLLYRLCRPARRLWWPYARTRAENGQGETGGGWKG